ncbi:hypothetical protein LCGC14_0441810 [marine sediment metagenome]|uniref:Uncharacterized protein n=1 Tax=marine sediment metagenome TaxID=412755 RepID=A0A0F9T3E0_9ZZZZ
MSYMKALCPYTFLDGESGGDYVYEDCSGEIYGANMTTETALDILFSELSYKDDNLILMTCLKAICNNLDIKLRDKPLEIEEFIDLQFGIHKKFRKKFEKDKEKLK